MPLVELELDPENPRLPEEVQGAPQAEILAYLFEHDVLTELAESYLINGFFANEALLVLPPDDRGIRVVVEGNRRLGALKYLTRDATAVEGKLPEHQVDPAPDPALIASLRSVPAIEVEDRDELSSYLGFRHISGLKTWAPEAKARYLYSEVEKAHAQGVTDPFYVIGRRVGSNALGVRNAYFAYNVLRVARDHLGLRGLASHVLNERFGVWTRLLGTANVSKYVGIRPAANTYSEVSSSTDGIDVNRLREVLQDLTPVEGSKRALLHDSRDVTDYSAVLANPSALEVMRQYGRLDIAAEAANGSDFDNRVQRILEMVQVATQEVLSGVTVTPESARITAELAKSARGLNVLVQAEVSDDDGGDA